MSKSLIETTGQFQLVDELHQVARANRPTVVELSNFFQTRAFVGQIKMIAALKDEATDAEFAKYWAEAEGDRDLAIQSFLSGFGVDAVVEVEVEAPKVRQSKRGK